jgi:two-component system, cell cycle response regulator DivK
MESKKVLIAEDSSVIQNLTKKILQIQNYQIFSAKNGLEVLSMLENESYDIILMDINMPKMDGMECAEKIRALSDPNKSKIPIVAITGNARNYTLEEFKKVGINDYLQKPLNFDNLVETVKNLTN